MKIEPIATNRMRITLDSGYTMDFFDNTKTSGTIQLILEEEHRELVADPKYEDSIVMTVKYRP